MTLLVSSPLDTFKANAPAQQFLLLGAIIDDTHNPFADC